METREGLPKCCPFCGADWTASGAVMAVALCSFEAHVVGETGETFNDANTEIGETDHVTCQACGEMYPDQLRAERVIAETRIAQRGKDETP